MAKDLENSLRSCVTGQKLEFAVKIGHTIVPDGVGCMSLSVCLSAALLSCPWAISCDLPATKCSKASNIAGMLGVGRLQGRQ
jgi:hypothetical protein